MIFYGLRQPQKDMCNKKNQKLISEKYKGMKISPEIKRLRGCLTLTEEEKNDERIQYILREVSAEI